MWLDKSRPSPHSNLSCGCCSIDCGGVLACQGLNVIHTTKLLSTHDTPSLVYNLSEQCMKASITTEMSLRWMSGEAAALLREECPQCLQRIPGQTFLMGSNLTNAVND